MGSHTALFVMKTEATKVLIWRWHLAQICDLLLRSIVSRKYTNLLAGYKTVHASEVLMSIFETTW